jgi:hypothetical protein
LEAGVTLEALGAGGSLGAGRPGGSHGPSGKHLLDDDGGRSGERDVDGDGWIGHEIEGLGCGVDGDDAGE